MRQFIARWLTRFACRLDIMAGWFDREEASKVAEQEYEAYVLAERRKEGGPVPSFVECGSCGAYHRVGFYGVCRDDEERFGPDQLDEQYGPSGWQEVKGGQA